MTVWIAGDADASGHKRHAGSKARRDIETIAIGLGAELIPLKVFSQEKTVSSFERIRQVLSNIRELRDKFSRLCYGDNLILQYPFTGRGAPFYLKNYIRSLEKRGVRVSILIHDLDSLRFCSGHNSVERKLVLQDKHQLISASSVICHNATMEDYLVNRLGVARANITSLGLFDYLTPYNPAELNHAVYKDRVVVAGNLSSDKAGYLYSDELPLPLRLYGVNYSNEVERNIEYMGSFEPEILPSTIKGSFGLVWDGPSCDTCTGGYGHYQRFNNPHKLSLYLTAGLPVIVWSGAATASFVKENNVGIAVDSLQDVKALFDCMDRSEYMRMVQNAQWFSKRLRAGFYTKDALRRAGVCSYGFGGVYE